MMTPNELKDMKNEARTLLLTAADAFEACPSLWTKDALWRNKHGENNGSVPKEHADGNCYCASGLVMLLSGDATSKVSRYARSQLWQVGFPVVNDEARSVHVVIQKLRKVASSIEP